ncbi:MAG TPA: DUF4153 domain-containing protein [Moraxellaceae bacterium]|nr:DUF4153 domain-containing protein [Moraxellaceae bacterium]
MMPASRPMVLVGALQGLVLWWLWRASEDQVWPATAPMLLGALLWAAIAVPAAYYLSENSGMPRARRRLLLLVVGAVYAGLGAYAGWMGAPLDADDQARRLIGHSNAFGQILGAMVMGFMGLTLAAGWQRATRRFDYPQLFVIAWRNAMLAASVAVLTQLFWAVLFSGAWLMKSIGLHFISELIQKPIFAFPVTGMVVGGAFAVGHSRAELLVHLRRYWLALNAWLLPLLLLFGVMWVAMLPVTGLEPLFATRNAAFTLLWFAALAVSFLNCAWQDGEDAPHYPRWLARLLAPAWLTLLFVAGIAGWALWQRIDQYGLTEDRAWGAFVWLLAMGYAVGYSASVLPSLLPRAWRERARARWFATVAPTNIAMALVAVACLALLTSPALDPRRLGVDSQLARLQRGDVAPADFDYRYLHWDSGQWGRQALQQLAQATGTPRDVAIAGFARAELARKSRWGDDIDAHNAPTAADLRARLTVLSAPGDKGAALPESLVDFLRQPGDRYNAPDCHEPGHQCAVWLHDFNTDGVADALVLDSEGQDDGVNVHLLTPDKKRWRQVDQFCCRQTLAAWSAAIARGEVTTVAPEWPDIRMGEKRFRVEDDRADRD